MGVIFRETRLGTLFPPALPLTLAVGSYLSGGELPTPYCLPIPHLPNRVPISLEAPWGRGGGDGNSVGNSVPTCAPLNLGSWELSFGRRAPER